MKYSLYQEIRDTALGRSGKLGLAPCMGALDILHDFDHPCMHQFCYTGLFTASLCNFLAPGKK